MKLRKRFGVVLVLAMLVSVLAMTMTASAAKKTKISKKSATIAAGQSVKLSVKNAKGKKVKWSSEDEDIAKVGSNGKVTGLTGGVAVIKAKVGGKSYKCNVTVEAVEFKNLNKEEPRIELYGNAGTAGNPDASNIISGANKYDLKANLSTYPAGLAVKWSTSNDKVATVEDGVVKAVTNGTCTVTATATDGSGAAASVVVWVTNLGEQDNTNPIVVTKANFNTVFDKYFTKLTVTEYCVDKNGKILPPGTEYAIVKDGKQETGLYVGIDAPSFRQDIYYVVKDSNIDVLRSSGSATLKYYRASNVADIVSKKGMPVTTNKKKVVNSKSVTLNPYYELLYKWYQDPDTLEWKSYVKDTVTEFPKDESEAIWYKVKEKKDGKDVWNTYEGKHYFAQYDKAGFAGKQILNFYIGSQNVAEPQDGCFTFDTIEGETFESIEAVLYKK